jgi:hypothetical protein
MLIFHLTANLVTPATIVDIREGGREQRGKGEKGEEEWEVCLCMCVCTHVCMYTLVDEFIWTNVYIYVSIPSPKELDMVYKITPCLTQVRKQKRVWVSTT